MMKGDSAIIDELNSLLAEELTAINQYFVHGEMCENWGYKKLHKLIFHRSIAEMKHAEKLIERVIFLDGKPIVSNLNEIHIGSEVPKQLRHDIDAEYAAVKHYNQAIKLSRDKADSGTRDLLEGILNDEEGHVDEIEALQDQIKQMGLQIFLGTQTQEE